MFDTDIDEERIACEVVETYVDQLRKIDGRDPVDWEIHKTEVIGSESDDVIVETTIRTTVPTGFLYLVRHTTLTREFQVFPFRDTTRFAQGNNDPVNHPKGYTSHPSGIECIEVTRHMNFNRGNATKYIWRAGEKNPETEVEDLEKAAWYIKDEIERVRAKRDAEQRHETAEVIKEEVIKEEVRTIKLEESNG